MIKALITKAQSGLILDASEIAELFKITLFSEESALIQVAARKIAEQVCQGRAEVHAQIGLNIAPCPNNCKFCSFAACNGVFSEAVELSAPEVISRTQQFEQDGANAIFIMATADYAFSKFLDMSQQIKQALKSETILIANVGDFSLDQAKQLKDVGYTGIYHALRLGEGRDTQISPEKRLATINTAHQAGLSVGTCLEPVGPEHTVEELVEKTMVTRDIAPAYSGAARRIPIPNTDLAQKGICSEARMAHILAVVRLALPVSIPGNCTHEPSIIGAAAGACLLWAEAGSNPRDTQENTEEKRGMTVQECRRVLEEAEWKVLDGPSRFYTDLAPQNRKKVYT
ncbi:radical SAM protein [bacterium]|nr:radical SAM protein [bacterium]